MDCAEGLGVTAQAIWGLFGGIGVVWVKIGQFVHKLPDDVRMTAKDRIKLVLWCLLPVFAAGCSVACHAHNEFSALYEGGALPSIFYAMANHYDH